MGYAKLRDYVEALVEKERSLGLGHPLKSSLPYKPETITQICLDAIPDRDAVDELISSAELLREHGQFHLPFESVFIGLPTKGGYTVASLLEEPEGAIFAFYSQYIHDNDDPTWRWHVYDGVHIIHPHQSLLNPNTLSADMMLGLSIAPGKNMEASKDALRLSIAALTLMHTKGVRSEVIRAPEKLNKARLKKRKHPLNDITIVRVQEHMDGRKTGTVGERHRPRMHLRRGHYRDQRYGPGRQKVRKVWIHPCIVGHEEDGTILHSHYEIDEGAA